LTASAALEALTQARRLSTSRGKTRVFMGERETNELAKRRNRKLTDHAVRARLQSLCSLAGSRFWPKMGPSKMISW
jgi:hypothetical protein